MSLLISIITVNYNDAKGLVDTIKSVQCQNYTNYEHIIIDGNSTDGSKEVIEKHKDCFSYWVSESDDGVYNAMNKGVKASKGEYLLFLNSGDVFIESDVLERISQLLISDIDIVYGDIVLLNDNREKTTRKQPRDLTFDFFYERTLAHQATFIKRTLFKTVFYYSEDLKIVSDWEFFICAICKHNATYKHVDVIISQYDDAKGISSLSENKRQMYQERKRVLYKHFPLFLKDYQELHKHRGTLGTNRFKMLLDLENYYLPKKMISGLLRILTTFYKRN